MGVDDTPGRSSVRRSYGKAPEVYRVFFAIVPLVLVVALSFMSWGGLGQAEYVGLANWRQLAADPTMIQSL